MRIICKLCQHPVDLPDRHRQGRRPLYCSSECLYLFWHGVSKRKLKSRPTKSRFYTCRSCQKLFERIKYKTGTVYCSEACRKDRRNDRDRQRLGGLPYVITCEHCRASATTRYKRQRFCSISCQHAARDERNNRVKTTIPCPTCGKDFIRNSTHLMYCSARCRRLSAHRANLAYAASQKGAVARDKSRMRAREKRQREEIILKILKDTLGLSIDNCSLEQLEKIERETQCQQQPPSK